MLAPNHNEYRYFGRAKDLPGVRELFQSRKKEEEEENQAFAFYKKFMNQGPSYYGDLDENDGTLIQHEHAAEEQGRCDRCESCRFSDIDSRDGRLGRGICQSPRNFRSFYRRSNTGDAQTG